MAFLHVKSPNGTSYSFNLKNIITQTAISGGSNGYLSLNNGIIFVWIAGNIGADKWNDITLPISVSSIYNVMVTDRDATANIKSLSPSNSLAYASGCDTRSGGMVTKIRIISDVPSVYAISIFVTGHD